MIPLSQPRPTPINIFAAAFLTAALVPFLDGISQLGLTETRLQVDYPYFPWSRDWVIIWLFSWLTIALIPLAMVWLIAAPFARWLVSAMTVLKAPGAFVSAASLMGEAGGEGEGLVSFAFAVLGVIMLFLPASQQWFAREAEVDPAVFE
ncbi:MAG: hypothetical protein ACK4IS_07830 [Erythrobacter sp.]